MESHGGSSKTASVPFVFGRNLYIMLSEEPEQAVGVAIIGPRGPFTCDLPLSFRFGNCLACTMVNARSLDLHELLYVK